MLPGAAKPGLLACGNGIAATRLGVGRRAVRSVHLPTLPHSAVLQHTAPLVLGRRAETDSHKLPPIRFSSSKDGKPVPVAGSARCACLSGLGYASTNPRGAASKRAIGLPQRTSDLGDLAVLLCHVLKVLQQREQGRGRVEEAIGLPHTGLAEQVGGATFQQGQGNPPLRHLSLSCAHSNCSMLRVCCPHCR